MTKLGTFAGVIAVLLSMTALGRAPDLDAPNLLLVAGTVAALILARAATRHR